MNDMEGVVTLPRLAYDQLVLAKATLDDIQLNAQLALRGMSDGKASVIEETTMAGRPGSPAIVMSQPWIARDGELPHRYAFRFGGTERSFMWIDLTEAGDFTVHVQTTDGCRPLAVGRLMSDVLPPMWGGK